MKLWFMVAWYELHTSKKIKSLLCSPNPDIGSVPLHPQASSRPLVKSLTTPLDIIGEVQLNRLSSWNRLVSSAQSTCCRQVQVRTVGRPLKNLSSACLIHSFTTCVLGSLSCWNTQLHPRASLLMIWGFPEEFRDNSPSSLFYLVSLEQQIHWQQNSPTV